jgi:hypothetical protein
MDSSKLVISGQQIRAPSAEINGVTVISTGRWLKIARIYDEDIAPNDRIGNPEQFINRIREAGLPADIFSFAPAFYSEQRFDYPHEMDNVAVIPITTYDNWLNNQIGTDVKQNIKKAPRRGVTTKVAPFDDELLAGIVGIYNETPIRQGRIFWHYGKNPETIRSETARQLERSDFIAAHFAGELIGFIKMIYTGEVADLALIVTKQAHNDKRAPNAMIAKAVEICAEKGIRYLRYAKMSYGKKRGSSLGEFKRRHGFEEIVFPRYFMPLTAKGRLAVGLRLYREIQEVLPERVQSVLLALRVKYYTTFVVRPGRQSSAKVAA